MVIKLSLLGVDSWDDRRALGGPDAISALSSAVSAAASAAAASLSGIMIRLRGKGGGGSESGPEETTLVRVRCKMIMSPTRK